jgi:hypothetical protein
MQEMLTKMDADLEERRAEAKAVRDKRMDTRTWGNWGSRSKLAAAGMRMAYNAKVARRREHGLQGQEKDYMAPRTPKGRTSRMKRWKDPEYKIEIKDPDTRRQLRLKI